MNNEVMMTIEECRFCEGEVYLFHKSDSHCPADSSLWGTFNRYDEDGVHLEILTTDCAFFRYWRLLPASHRIAIAAWLRAKRSGIFSPSRSVPNTSPTVSAGSLLRGRREAVACG